MPSMRSQMLSENIQVSRQHSFMFVVTLRILTRERTSNPKKFVSLFWNYIDAADIFCSQLFFLVQK